MYRQCPIIKMFKMMVTKLIYMIILKEIHFSSKSKLTLLIEKTVKIRNRFFQIYKMRKVK
jgi:hypothetical protein